MALIGRLRRARCVRDLPLTEFWIAIGLVGLDVVARLPHAPNFTPVAASALFAGAVLRSRVSALAVPIAAMLINDLVLGCPDWRIMAVVYAALAAPAVLGRWGRPRGAPLCSRRLRSRPRCSSSRARTSRCGRSAAFTRPISLASLPATSRRCHFCTIPCSAICFGPRFCSAAGGVQNFCLLRRRAACYPQVVMRGQKRVEDARERA